MKKKSISTEEFDRLFEEGKDIQDFLDMKTARRQAIQTRRVNVDFPEWMIHLLDHEAARLGVTRQSIIKFWISERLKAS